MAQKPKMLISTLPAVILIMAAVVGCTFTGAGRGDTEEDVAMDEPAGVIISDENMFGVVIPGSGGSLYLNKYPVDFPFGLELAEESRESFRAESFGTVNVVGSGGL